MHNHINKLFRWKAIADEFLKHSNSGYPTTRIHRTYIYPKFFISIRTLNTILGTNIDRELKAAGYSEEDVSKILSKYESVQESQKLPEMQANQISSNPYMKPTTQFNQIF